MKYAIVNADDFGASKGINRAIEELHALGIVTSASFMVDMPAAGDAAAVSKRSPQLDVGLHAVLTDEDAKPLLDFEDSRACARELHRQVGRFVRLLDRLPTHLDSHQNVHRDPRLEPLFVDLASEYRLPLREHSPVRYFPDFYGQWDGESHPEHISVEQLLVMLERELLDGVTEVACHPGYVDAQFSSPYHAEREVELRTLCDARVGRYFAETGVKLVRFVDVARLPLGAANR